MRAAPKRFLLIVGPFPNEHRVPRGVHWRGTPVRGADRSDRFTPRARERDVRTISSRNRAITAADLIYVTASVRSRGETALTRWKMR